MSGEAASVNPADLPLQHAVDGRRDTDRIATRGAQERAWAEHWSSHHGKLVRYATYLLSGDVHAAEDVVQETAIRLWQHAEMLADDHQHLSGWLRRVTRNIVIDRSRRRRARPAEVSLGADVDSESADDFIAVDAESAVTTILSGLSPRHRAAVYEVYARDRPVVDVAADLGIRTGTVKSRCHTALRQLRSCAAAECP